MAVALAPRTPLTEEPITDDDLMRLPKDGRKWELVGGGYRKCRRVSSMTRS